MARTKNPVSLTQFIASRREEELYSRRSRTRVQDAAAEFAPAYAVVNAIMTKAMQAGQTDYMFATPSVSAWGEHEKRMDAGFTLRDVPSLKEGLVPEICEAIMSYGFEPTGSKDYATETWAQRALEFRATIGAVEVKLTVEAIPSEESTSCRRVKVGTETKVVDKFAIVCGE